MDPTRGSKSCTKRQVPWKGRARTSAPKTNFVRVRYDPEGRARLDARAAAAHMTLSDFIRHVTEGPGGPRPRRKPPVEIRELARTLAELGKWGSNVNQMARVANTNGDLPALRSLAQIKEFLKANRRDLLRALGRDH
jgi:mobilization protein NikA